MYISLKDQPARTRTEPKPARRRVAGTVITLGIVSLLTDVSSESANAILPIYLTSVLGLSAFAYGFIDGVYQGVSALVRILGGWLADRADRPKWIAFVGYAVSAVSRVALIPAHGLAALTSVISLDRLGKGLRTAPRDALIATSTPPADLGRAFGVHRSLDTVGAMLGPLMAFWILLLVPSDYRAVFIASFAFAVIGLAVLLLFVPDLRPRRRPRPGRGDEDADGDGPAGVLTRPSLRLLIEPRLLRLCAGTTLLGLLTIGDGFLYLQLTERDSLATKYFPLLYVGSNFAYLVLAVPFGRLADRIGRVRVFIGGHLALLLAYVAAGGPVGGAAASVTCLMLLGAYYAATDGVLAAIAGQVVPTSVRTSGIATAQTVQALARFAASLGFGLMWTTIGRLTALHTMIVLLAIGIPVGAVLLRNVDRHPSEPEREAASS
jgi:MFS family permease